MINKTLSDLAADYASGNIDIHTYRKNRTELLRGIVAGHIPVHPIDYLPPLESEEEAAVTQPMARETTQILGHSVPRGNLTEAIETTLPPASEKSYKSLYIGISIAIVVLLIIAVVMFYPQPPAMQAPHSETDAAMTSESQDAGLSKPGEALISDFLQQNTWIDDSLDAFMQEWNSLTSEQQLAAASTKRMQRLSSEIYNRFLEEKALLSIDPEKGRARQQALIDFAQSIGIVDTRMQIE